MASLGFRPLLIVALALIAASAAPVDSQEKCVSDVRAEEVRKQIIDGAEHPANAALGKELGDMRTALAATDSTLKRSDPALRARKEEFATRVCSILNTHGWPMRASIGDE